MSTLGKIVLFVGTESRNWGDAELTAACQYCKSMSIDTLAVKRADGTGRWYTSTAQLVHEHQLCNSLGVGYLPYTYCYGPKFGITRGECDILNEIRATLGFVMADMEVEYNGQINAAQEFASYMQGHPGDLYITTWADPNEQAWQSIIPILAPVTAAFDPQQYNNWLSTRTNEWGSVKIWPAVDVLAEFGANNPALIAQQAASRGDETLFIWEYQTGRQNSGIVSAIVTAFKGSAPALPPAPTPAPIIPVPAPIPAPVPQSAVYVVQSGDTLSSIAAKYPGVSWQDIWDANRNLIGWNPNLIKAGQQLTIPHQGTDRTYIVQRSDSLSIIASKLGIASWQQLYEENRNVIGTNPNIIVAGQILHY